MTFTKTDMIEKIPQIDSEDDIRKLTKYFPLHHLTEKLNRYEKEDFWWEVISLCKDTKRLIKVRTLCFIFGYSYKIGSLYTLHNKDATIQDLAIYCYPRFMNKCGWGTEEIFSGYFRTLRKKFNDSQGHEDINTLELNSFFKPYFICFKYERYYY